MVITGYHTLSFPLVSGEDPTVTLPMVNDDMKRFLGNLLVNNAGTPLMVNVRPVVYDEPEQQLRQEVFVAKIKPEDCDVGDALYITGEEDFFLQGDMAFEHKSYLSPFIYERVG